MDPLPPCAVEAWMSVIAGPPGEFCEIPLRVGWNMGVTEVENYLEENTEFSLNHIEFEVRSKEQVVSYEKETERST